MRGGGEGGEGCYRTIHQREYPLNRVEGAGRGIGYGTRMGGHAIDAMDNRVKGLGAARTL